jgi:succinate dehydrogenase / fumarate reductase flavoprotein subunit
VKHQRTCFAGASTGQQLLYSVDQQVRRLEAKGLVKKQEWWELLSVVKDNDGICRGIVAMDLRSLEVHSFRADAVVLATGGLGQIYAPRTTNSTNSTGAAASRVYQQGARFANAEFFQFHPSAMLGDDKTRLMSEAARGEGGRIWVPRDPDDRRPPNRIPQAARFYFLEEWFPAYGNTVSRDEAARAIWRVVREMGLGVGGADKVYLDLTHLDAKFASRRLGAILQIYRKFHGVDPLAEPMEIFPAAHYAMGGLWVDFEKDPATDGIRWNSPRNHTTSIPGLYACGECDYGYHGANRLGANSLLSASFSGRVAGESVVAYLHGLASHAQGLGQVVFDAAVETQASINQRIVRGRGSENPYALRGVLGRLMTANVGVVRHNAELDVAIAQLQELEERAQRINLGETSTWANQALAHARQLSDMITLARVIASSARERDECRGAHHKPEFDLPMPEGKFSGDPEFEAYRDTWKANNARWLKTTIAEHSPQGPRISYQAVDTSVLAPEHPRDYR